MTSAQSTQTEAICPACEAYLSVVGPHTHTTPARMVAQAQASMALIDSIDLDV